VRRSSLVEISVCATGQKQGAEENQERKSIQQACPSGTAGGDFAPWCRRQSGSIRGQLDRLIAARLPTRSRELR
jgi:hypothetical protein